MALEIGRRRSADGLVPVRCPPQRLEPLRWRHVSITSSDGCERGVPAKPPGRSPGSQAMRGKEKTAHRPDRLPASCSGVKIRFCLLTVAGAAPELKSAIATTAFRRSQSSRSQDRTFLTGFPFHPTRRMAGRAPVAARSVGVGSHARQAVPTKGALNRCRYLYAQQ